MSDILLGELQFWALFFLFNFLQFAWNYVMQFKESRFLPVSLKNVRDGFLGIFVSTNPDIFRLSLETLLVILWVRFYPSKSPIIIFSIIYVVIFAFNAYHYSFRYLYKTNPILANDIPLLRDGMAILYNESKFRFMFFVSALFFLLFSLSWGFYSYLKFTSALEIHTLTWWMSGLVALYVMMAIARKGLYKPGPDNNFRVAVFIARLFFHYKLSKLMLDYTDRIEGVIKKDGERYHEKMPLFDRPNLHFIFLESYGSILLRSDKIKNRFTEQFNSLKESLFESGWGTRSQMSKSVSLIGPSWLSYSSFLYGLKIESQFMYERLMKNEQFHSFSIFEWLRNNGYTNFNLNPTKWNDVLKVPMDTLTQFYHVDQWILGEEMGYRGPSYGFGEFPPDQFTLNYAWENHLSKCQSPYVLFYLTKNSHSPFFAPEGKATNWRDINTDVQSKERHGKFLDRPSVDNYYKAVKYELEVIHDIILKQARETDIFFLIGDHQPHHIANRSEHGLETIVHVIAKNERFLKGFEEYGFTEALLDNPNPITIQGLHSIITRGLIRTFSESHIQLPKYRAFGYEF